MSSKFVVKIKANFNVEISYFAFDKFAVLFSKIPCQDRYKSIFYLSKSKSLRKESNVINELILVAPHD